MGLADLGLGCLKSVHIFYESSFFIDKFTRRITKKGGTAAKIFIFSTNQMYSIRRFEDG
jgi:hypothetical protein